MVDLYSADGNGPDDVTAEHIGFCHILPNNLKQTSGTISMPINGTSQQPIGQLTGKNEQTQKLTLNTENTVTLKILALQCSSYT